MSTIAVEHEITPAELLARSDGVDYELVHGELVERKLTVHES